MATSKSYEPHYQSSTEEIEVALREAMTDIQNKKKRFSIFFTPIKLSMAKEALLYAFSFITETVRHPFSTTEQVKREKMVEELAKGYQYAAEKLLKQEKTAQELSMQSFGEREPFNRGVMNALGDWDKWDMRSETEVHKLEEKIQQLEEEHKKIKKEPNVVLKRRVRIKKRK